MTSEEVIKLSIEAHVEAHPEDAARAERAKRIFLRTFHKLSAAGAQDHAADHTETRALLSILADETNSKDVHQRVNALLGRIGE